MVRVKRLGSTFECGRVQLALAVYCQLHTSRVSHLQLNSARLHSKQDELQQEVRTWYAQFKHNKKRALVAKLQEVFARIESGAEPTATVQAGGAAEEVQPLRDLQFRDIPKGPYASAMQRLLAQVLKLESKVRVLEQLLTAALSGGGGEEG
jgi:outer membrane murein-binding lipoprotein Lpp